MAQATPGNELSPSRELRIAAQVPTTDLEHIAFKIYRGDAGELAGQLSALELVMEYKRRQAAEGLGQLLKVKLADTGYLVTSDIDDALAEFSRNEVMGLDSARQRGWNDPMADD